MQFDCWRQFRSPATLAFQCTSCWHSILARIIRGTLTARAGSISFSSFMALFPFLLFILNLIPFIPIENFDTVLLQFIELLLPTETQGFFSDIFLDIQQKPRGGLLSSVFVLSIFLIANGVSAIFSSFEESYHIELSFFSTPIHLRYGSRGFTGLKPFNYGECTSIF